MNRPLFTAYYIINGCDIDIVHYGFLRDYQIAALYHSSSWKTIPGRYLHRIGGPAVEHRDGRKEWFLDGVHYKDEEAYYVALTSIKNMPASLRLTDPRKWVREFK